MHTIRGTGRVSVFVVGWILVGMGIAALVVLIILGLTVRPWLSLFLFAPALLFLGGGLSRARLDVGPDGFVWCGFFGRARSLAWRAVRQVLLPPPGARSHTSPSYGFASPPVPGPAASPALGPAASPALGPAANIALGVVAIVWAGLGLIGHTGMTLYLGLGAVMTYRLDGVFGDDPNGAFNRVVLLTALVGQLLGLAVSVTAILLGIRAKRKRMRRATTAMVLGIVATSVFLLIGFIQLPLVSLLFELASHPASSAFAG